MTDPHSPLDLVRRYEPVLHYTAGEMFFPMPVHDYLARASLWMTRPDQPVLVIDHGGLDADKLAAAAREHPDEALFLRYAPASLQRAALKAWRNRPDRPTFHGVSRLAAVGMMGRIIDLGMRLSLVVRGRVPGGLTAASQQQYAQISPPRDAYHAYVSSDGGYVVIQYWFLYAMNDWRSSFSGVNDHESDWEQVTMYLAPDGVGNLVPAWIAFSSHDETGDELRRRSDDPDITWVDRTHPVVNAGAGSHSGAYLHGDYLVRVQPPAIAKVFSAVTAIRSRLFPWTRGHPSLGVGIPYVDYRRGDGVAVGPGTSRPWTPIFIDSNTPWVRDFRGLWGLDTADPFGGERAPAGPRYERSGAIRASWGDPVGWAGLDKVPPTPTAVADAEQARIAALDELIAGYDTEIASAQESLRQAATGIEVLPPSVTDAKRDGLRARLAVREADIAAVRARRRDAINERDQLQQVPAVTVHPSPHAHLRHRSMPDTSAPAGLVLRFWAGASLSVLLILLGLSLLLEVGPLVWTTIAAVVIVMAIEALLRRRLALFLLGLAIVAASAAVIWLLITHIRVALGVLALVAAVAIAVANLRTLARR